MSYIKNERHFKNFISKVARESGIDKDQLCPLDFYVQNVYHGGYADEYTWRIHESEEWLLRDKVLEFLSGQRSPDLVWPHKWDRLSLSDDFGQFLEDIYGQSGVYVFERESGSALYVGRSTTNLQSRVTTSFTGRFDSFNEQIYLKVAFCSQSDAAIFEVYLIAKLKPPLNRDCKFEDQPSIIIQNIPTFSERVCCFSEYAPNIRRSESKEEEITYDLRY